MIVGYNFAAMFLGNSEFNQKFASLEAIEWYNKLDINTKINVKGCFKLACGVEFESLSSLFNIKERISILYNKLKMLDIKL